MIPNVALMASNRKAIVVLEELGLNYKLVNLDFSKNEHKAAEYTAVNPNGRVPALIDHKNGDFIVWCVFTSDVPWMCLLMPLMQGVGCVDHVPRGEVRCWSQDLFRQLLREDPTATVAFLPGVGPRVGHLALFPLGR